MIIEEIVLENFRQYYGRQSIRFAHGEEGNVTVIHGENGAGKTALINAFLWVLYGKALSLPNPNEIVNRRFFKESQLAGIPVIEASVHLSFIEGADHYELTRVLRHQLLAGEYVPARKSDVTLKRILENGESEVIKSVTDTIDKIIPQKLSSFFFFDGERIDNLGKQKSKKEIKDSIKLMMGLNLFVGAQRDVKKAKILLQEELAKKSGGEYERLIEKRKALFEEKEENNQILSELRANVSALMEEIKGVDEKLKADEEIGTLQTEYDAKTQELERTNNALAESEAELAKLLSGKGYLMLALPLMAALQHKMSTNDDPLESYVTEELLSKLETEEMCICGRPLSEHEQGHFKSIQDSPYYSGNFGSHQLKKKLDVMDEKRKGVFERIKLVSQQRNQHMSHQSLIRQEIAEIKVNQDGRKNPDLKELQEKFNKLEENIQQSRGMIFHHEKQRDDIQQRIEVLEKQIEKQRNENLKELRLQSSLATADKFEKMITRLLEFQERDVKERLALQIKEVFSKFLRKNYEVEMTDDYELIVTDGTQEEVGMSQGEGQLTSLAFIGAIVDMQRKKATKSSSEIQIKGANTKAVYPIVMDSPFGALDADHRKRVAEGIHQLSDQVVVIVSTSQWDGEVEAELSHRAGREYTLKYLETTDELEYTQIMEGRH